MDIVDDGMTPDELLASIETELDGYVDRNWRPERIKITKGRIRAPVGRLDSYCRLAKWKHLVEKATK